MPARAAHGLLLPQLVLLLSLSDFFAGYFGWRKPSGKQHAKFDQRAPHHAFLFHFFGDDLRIARF
jgi:hypothetical protein